jgi:hypothetical protein
MENLNIYVFTSKYVINNNSEITFACHDEDGDWQFLSDEETVEEDAMVVSLGEILEHDPTLKEILSLPAGGRAEREGIGSPWNIE